VDAGAAAARRGVSVPICTELTFVFVVPVLVLVPVVVPVVVVVVLGMVTEVFGVVRVVVYRELRDAWRPYLRGSLEALSPFDRPPGLVLRYYPCRPVDPDVSTRDFS
jgi:hypothetical protein